MNKHFRPVRSIGLALPKKVGTLSVLILMAWMALTNPSPERVQAAFGDPIEVSLNLVLFTLALVPRETYFREKPHNEALTHGLSNGWEFSGYHIGIFGKLF